MNQARNFSLKWLLILVTLCGLVFAAFAALKLYGVVILGASTFAIYLLTAKVDVDYHQRILVLFMSAGAAIFGWATLSSLGSASIPFWGPLDEIGGWAVGTLVGAWRFSCLSAPNAGTLPRG